MRVSVTGGEIVTVILTGSVVRVGAEVVGGPRLHGVAARGRRVPGEIGGVAGMAT